jgi:hypothetical protein
MSWSLGPSNTASNLSHSVHQQINMYAIAAGAAGVSLLALAQPSEGKIIYTKANVRIVPNGGLISFDLKHDGIPDFSLSNRTSATLFAVYGGVQVYRAQAGNEIWGATSQSRGCAAALRPGKRVGPKGAFKADPYGLIMAERSFDSGSFGPWLKVNQAFLGLKFKIKGKTHFGWARVRIDLDTKSITATLTGYAYETIPNKPIIAGETKGPDAAGDMEQASPATVTTPPSKPRSLALLAMGSQGLFLWRREKPAAIR